MLYVLRALINDSVILALSRPSPRQGVHIKVKAYLPKSSQTRAVLPHVAFASSVKWPCVKSQGPHTHVVLVRGRHREGTRVSPGVLFMSLSHLISRRGRSIIILSITVNTRQGLVRTGGKPTLYRVCGLNLGYYDAYETSNRAL